MTALADARTRRDAGMALAAEAEDRVQPDYAAALYAAILTVARRQAQVHVDDVLPLLTVRPKHFNAAGMVWRRAIADGVIVRTGRTRVCSVDRRKHAHGSPVYRSTLFGRAAAATVPGKRASRTAAPSRQIEMFGEAQP